MAYTVLARRYRSANFDQVIGQEHVAQTLKKAIASGRIAHAYLFCGTRGTGKTSTARILAKALNCQKSDGPTPDPCGVCNSCVAITRGESLDVIEIDAASNTQVEKTREIIENAQYRPASRFKIYIIDEVHMLSKASFNALLKTMEEPPEHVKFILATTEPEKVLPTILSRCQRYDFRNIPTQEITRHLRNIITQEKLEADDDALQMVAKAGAGSMRDSLSLLDRLLSAGETRLTLAHVEELLGLPKVQLIFNLIQAVGTGDVKSTLGQLDEIFATGLSPDTLIASTTDHLRNLLILRTCGADSTLVEVPGLPIKDLMAQAGRFDPPTLTQDITLLEELRRLARQGSASRALIDATFVRIALAEQFTGIADLLSQADGAPAAQKKKPELAAPPPPVFQPATLHTQSAADPEVDDDLPRPGKVWDNSGPSLSDMLKQRPAELVAAPHPDSNVVPVAAADVASVWQSLRAAASLAHNGIDAFLGQSRLTGFEEDESVAVIAASNAFARDQLDRNGKKDVIKEMLSKILDRPVGLRVILEDIPKAPAALKLAAVVANPAHRVTAEPEEPAPSRPAAEPVTRMTPELREQLRSDPYIKSVLENLGGEILKVEP